MNITLPVDRERGWGTKLNKAITDINTESSGTAQVIGTGRLSIDNLRNTIDERVTQALGDVELVGTTVDGGEAVKIIMYGNGTMRAVPLYVEAPAAPTALVAVASASMVTLTWANTPEATTYYVYRDGSYLATVTTNSYRDKAVAQNGTYSYTIAAANQFGMVGPRGGSAAATVNPALNVPPVVRITTFPKRLPTSGKAIVRVNARDADAQALALALGTSTGQLEPTLDPSVWLFTI